MRFPFRRRKEPPREKIVVRVTVNPDALVDYTRAEELRREFGEGVYATALRKAGLS